jgi:peptidoglycan/LPS O-acetylase OafA/YrhL
MTGTEKIEPRWIQHGRVPCLDGLRAVSILFVLLEHAAMSRSFPLSLPLSRELRLNMFGHLGVSMFFAISGFLITMLLAREWNRTGTVSLRGFYRRRALRILPAYVTFLVVVYLLTRVHLVDLARTDWIGVLTYTVNFIREPAWAIGHVWSLSVEEQFYLVWPFVVLLLAPRRALFVVLAYLAAAPLIRVGIWAFFRSELHVIEELTPLRLDAIAAGCALALLAEKDAFRARFRQTSSQASWTIAVAVVAIAAGLFIGGDISAFDVTLRYSVEAAAMTAIIWSAASAPTTRIGRVLETRPLVWIGVLSYSLYLWQQLFLTPHSTHWTASFPLNVAFAGGAAVVSYYVVESPFLRIKDRKPAHAAAPSPRPGDVTQPAAQSI